MYLSFSEDSSRFCPGVWFRLLATAAMTAIFLASASCFSVKTEHRIEPIQITMDVNVRLEKELEDAFSELDARSREIAAEQSEEGETL
jgi:hypothetical protein